MVKQGYKRTEIGMIPEDWDWVPLKDVCQFIGGGTPSKTIPEFWNGKIPWVSSSDIVEGDIYTININRHITDKAISLSATHKCPRGTILVVSRVGVGKVAISSCDVCTSQDFTNLIPKKHEPLFLTYVLVPIMQGKATEAQGTSIKGVTTESIKQTKIIFPPLEEQKHIAEALSDVDSIISSLEKLIAKKKAVKQGAMQELLTGKKRLPGFDGEWNTFVFGELFDFIPNNAFTRAQMSDSGKVKNIHYGDILTLFGLCIDGDNNSIPYINQDIDLTRFADRCYLQSGDVIIADTAEDETVGKALEIDNVNSPVLAGQHTLLCRSKIKFADKFLGYYLNAACYHDQLLPFIVGTKVSSVSKSSVAQTKLVVPDFEEQTAIASILSDMDNEIEALEQKLAKTRQIKQGMMQQLLTGKIRLV